MIWQTARFEIDLARPKVMGIVNVTPDSFSDGGAHDDASSALAHCERLLAEGADILDIGGESTRPGAATPSLDEELRRVLPVVRGAVRLGCPVSVDTSRPEVMRAALELGADIVNDVRALQRTGAVAALAAHPAAGVCLMHMRGEPGSMQQDTDYADVVLEVRDFLLARARVLQEAGVALFEAMPLAVASLGNAALRENFVALQARVVAGQPLALALQNMDFPGQPQLRALVASGEASGTLPAVLLGFAQRQGQQQAGFEEQLATWLPRLAYLLVAVWMAHGLISGGGIGPSVPADLR